MGTKRLTRSEIVYLRGQVLRIAARMRSQGEEPTPEGVRTQLRMGDDRSRRILDAASVDPKGADAVRKVIARALRDVQRAQAPRLVKEWRTVSPHEKVLVQSDGRVVARHVLHRLEWFRREADGKRRFSPHVVPGYLWFDSRRVRLRRLGDSAQTR